MLREMDLLYLFMAWVALQVLTMAFDMEGKIAKKFKIIFPLATTFMIYLLMRLQYIPLGR